MKQLKLQSSTYLPPYAKPSLRKLHNLVRLLRNILIGMLNIFNIEDAVNSLRHTTFVDIALRYILTSHSYLNSLVIISTDPVSKIFLHLNGVRISPFRVLDPTTSRLHSSQVNGKSNKSNYYEICNEIHT